LIFFKFDFEVTGKNDNEYIVKISNSKEYAVLTFNYITKNICFINDNEIVKFLKDNKYQLSKILRNKRESTYNIGFKLKIVLRDNKDIVAFNDNSKIAVLNKLDGKYISFVLDKGIDNIYEVFTDGSYLEKQEKGGFSYIIKSPDGEYELFQKTTDVKSSSLIELLAAIDAVKYLKNKKYIRIISDSQYVKKGLTEWVMIWKLNDWKTANGKDVKNKEYWIMFDKLCNNKYIEFKWVKAHSEHFENSLCDIYAKEIALNVGGVGAFAIEALVRAGIGKITIVDFDVIEISNLNRQIHTNTENIGKLKAEEMGKRLKLINPELEINVINEIYNIETHDVIFNEKWDYIVDAIDMVSSKLLIIDKANKFNIKIISSMGTANKIDPSKFLITDIKKTHTCPLARKMRKSVKELGIKKLKVLFSTEKPDNFIHDMNVKGTISFVPSVAGLLIASEVVKDIIDLGYNYEK